jgi:hypothetical protein
LNGASAAVAKDNLIGYGPGTKHFETNVNDGKYGNPFSWIGNSLNSWVKIDLGCCYLIHTVVFGRDQLGAGYTDRSPGRVTVSVATNDVIYASGDATNDDTEYTEVLKTDDFSFLTTGTHTASITTTAPGRFVKFQVENNGACIDELEIYGVPCATSESPRGSPSASPSASPSSSPSANRLLSLHTLLAPSSVPGEIQYQAVEWLANTDPAALSLSSTSEEIFRNRYALVVLYYSSNGDDWHNNENWLSDTSVCSWYRVDCSSDVVMSVNLGRLLDHQDVSTACFVETHNARHLSAMHDIVTRI